jgi:excisionase family DNA binding protein
MLGMITDTQEQPIALTIERASRLSDLSKPFIRLEVKRGKLRSIRPGGSKRVLILMSDFLDYLKGEKEDEK